MRRLLIACGLLACTSAFISSDAARESSEVLVRIETRAGAFMVRQAFAEEFQGVLAGELTERPLMAGSPNEPLRDDPTSKFR